MSDPNNQPASDDSAEARIDRLADQFEQAWRRGEPPSIPNYLRQIDAEQRRPLAIELVKIDLAYRARAGAPRRLEQYAEELPELIGESQSLPDDLVRYARQLAEPAAEETASLPTQPTPRDGVVDRDLRIQCPHCGHPVRVASPEVEEVTCLSCGSSLRVDAWSQRRRHSAPRLPRPLGKFQLLELLGVGAFGAVYRARDSELERTVAIKIPRSGYFASDEEEQRFLNEARTAAGLRHAGIVQVHQVDRVDGMPLIVSDFIDGQTLTDYATERKLSFQEIAELTAQVAEALDHAHQAGVFHRDVKPSNILIEGDGRPVLTDFGLARRDEAEIVITLDGQVLGTPAYMSPEQAAGESSRVDGRADVYSLGVVLYELLTGERPFRGSTRRLLEQVLHDDPRPPRRLNEHIPRDLETICLQALAKSRARRYASAGDLAADLRRFLLGEPTIARPISRVEKFWRVCRRYPARAAAIAGAFIAAFVAFLVWFWWPGSLTIDVKPAGATVRVAGREYVAGGEPLQLSLRHGGYAIEATAPDHFAQRREAVVQRGRVKHVSFDLRHHRGVLDLECATPGAEIEINGKPHGSRVPNLPVKTGTYEIKAWADGHFESQARRITLARDQRRRERFWLDNGIRWSYSSPGLQGMLIAVDDVDGDGAADIAHNEIGRIVIFSSRDGGIAWQMPAPWSGQRTFEQFDLGGAVGKVLVAGKEEQATPAQKAHIHLLAIKPGRPTKVLWEQRIETGAWKAPQPIWIHMAGDHDPEPDGVADLLVGGREGELRVVSGANGATLKKWTLMAEPVRTTPLFRVFQHEGAEWAAYVYYPGSGDSPPPNGATPVVLGAVRLSDGVKREPLRLKDGLVWMFDLDRDGRPELFWRKDRAWRVYDAAIKPEPRYSGQFPAGYEPPAMPILADIDRNGADEFLLISESADAPSIAVRPADGAVVWRGPKGLRKGQPLSRDGRLQAAPGGGYLLAAHDAVLAVEPNHAEPRWRVAGQLQELLIGDWEGDGQREVFIGLRQRGVTCVDHQGRVRWTLRLRLDVGPRILMPDTDGDSLAELVIIRHAAMIGLVDGPRVIWSARATAPLEAAPQPADTDGDGRPDTVIQLGPWREDSSLVGLDLATGDVRWQAKLNLQPNRAAALCDWNGDGRQDVAHLGMRRGRPEWRLLVVSGADGKVIHDTTVESGTLFSQPVAVDLNNDGQLDLAVHRWDDQDVIALDGRTGKPLWEEPYNTAAENHGGVAAADLNGDGAPDIVAPSRNGLVHAVSGATGKSLWKKPSPLDAGSSTPARLADVTGDGVPEVLVTSHSGRLYVLAGADGEQLWSTAPAEGSRATGGPVVTTVKSRPVILVPHGDAGLVAYDWRARKPRWRTPKGVTVVAEPVVADLDGDGVREVIVAGNRRRIVRRREDVKDAPEVVKELTEGFIYVLDLSSGRVLWSYRVSEKPISADPAVAHVDGDGVLDILVAGYDFRLTAVSGFPTKSARRAAGR